MALDDETAVLAAYDFDDEGVREITGEGLRTPLPEGAWRWIHLDRMTPSSREWLRNESGVPPAGVEILLEKETRPRVTVAAGGTIVILRGVNLNIGAKTGAMLSLRIWVEPGRVISLRRSRLFALDMMREAMAAGWVPASPGDFLARLAAALTARTGEQVEATEARLDPLEEASLERGAQAARREVADLRRGIVAFRRYLAPQRDAVSKLEALQVPWISDADRAALNETAEELTGIVEQLDSLRDRALIVQEVLANRVAEQLNHNMYLLSVIAALFLPLGFLTGLLGINVGGIPLAESSWGFAAVCVLLAALVGGQALLFRRLRWF